MSNPLRLQPGPTETQTITTLTQASFGESFRNLFAGLPFFNFGGTPRPDRGKSIPRLPTENETRRILTPIDGLFSALFQSNRGVFVGERHSDVTSKAIVTDYLIRHLPSWGVRVLFLEAVAHRDQPALNEYLATGRNREGVLRSLREYGWDVEGFMKLIDSARAAGVRVVGTDLRGRSLEERDRFAANVVRQELRNQPQGAKFMYFGGSSHSNNRYTNSSGQVTFGLDYLLGIPSVDMVTRTHFSARGRNPGAYYENTPSSDILFITTETSEDDKY